LAQPRSYSAMTEILGEISGPLVIVADTHLGLIAGKRIYGISNNSASDTLGFAGFIQWLQHLELNTVQVARGSWGKEPLQIRKPNSLILLGDYLELWDSTDDAVDISSRGIWNELEKLSCKKLYVIGNHDYEISEVKGTYPQGMGSIQVLPSTCPPEESKESETKNQEHESWLKIGGVSYLFLHGHQFDASFRHFGKAWTFVSYLRDGAEAFRLWSWVLTAIGLGMAFVAFVLSNSIAWSVALTLLITVGAPRLIITVARPIYAKFGTRYQVEKALNNIASWWKDYAKKNNVPSGNLRVVYGHTHLIDVYDSSDFGQKLPDQLTLVNLPSWVMDVREEYSKILRDVALYVDDDGFHFLGWDWEKREPFYIPTDVAKVIAGGNAIDGRIAQELKAIGWPDKLLSKLVQPPQIPSLKHPASEARRALYNRLQSIP